MIERDWKSTALRHAIEDPESCPVCAFLAGDRSPEILFKVIELMDARLWSAEKQNRYWVEYVTSPPEDQAKGPA